MQSWCSTEDHKRMNQGKAFRGMFKVGDFNSVCSEFGLCLCAHRSTDEIYLPSGTAVMVGPGIAMTARHVIEDFFANYDNRKFTLGKPTGSDRGTFWLFALHPGSGAQWVVDLNYFLAEEGPDIAFLYLKPDNEAAKERQHIFAPLSLNLPKIGETIFAYGFVDESNHLGKEPSISFGDGTKRVLVYSAGIIKEIHENYRDTTRMKFPCFQTNARYDGGMSGGPIFNLQEEVIGLVCSTLPAEDDSQEHISYGTLLWPALLIRLSIPFPNLSEKYPALHLAENGIMKIKGWEKCILIEDGEGYYSEIRIYK